MFVMLHLAGDLFLEVQLPSASWWFILDFSCVNSLPLCLRSFVETSFKHAMLGGWGLTDEKSYDAVSTKPSCKTFDKRLHSICIWFRNEPFFYGIYKFSFYRRLCPWHATLALGFSSQQVNTLCQDLDRSPVLSERSEILVAILWQWVEAAEKANRAFVWFFFFFKVWWFSSSGQGFSLFLIYCWVHQIKLYAPRQVWLCWRPGDAAKGQAQRLRLPSTCGGTEPPRCRDNCCGAASTGVRLLFSSSHDLHRFLPRLCLLNSLPRRAHLSFRPFLLPAVPALLFSHCLPLAPLPLRPARGTQPTERPDARAWTALSLGTTANGFALSPALEQAGCAVSLPRGSAVRGRRAMGCMPRCRLWWSPVGSPSAGAAGQRAWCLPGGSPGPTPNPATNPVTSSAWTTGSLGKRSQLSGGTRHLFAYNQLRHREACWSWNVSSCWH